MLNKHVTMVSTIAIAVSATLLPETLFLEKLRQFRAKYRWDQTEEPITEKIQQRFQDVINDIDVPKKKKKILRIFHNYGYDVYHGGSFLSKKGIIIGVPIHFKYEDVESMNKNDAFIFDKPITCDTPVAETFLNTLVLSENAQKFAMAREILKIQIDDPCYKAMHVILHIVTLFLMYNVIENVLKLSTRKRGLRYFITSAIIVGGIITGYQTMAAMNYDSDITVDDKLSKLGPDYIQGGKEFYEKLLKRNISLRTLLGEDGKRFFTANGNENYIIFERSAPIFNRKSFFDSKLQNIQQLV